MRLSKKFTLAIVFTLTVFGLLMVEPCVATVNKPVTPTFTLEEISSPYDVPPTYTTDPYTGETILTNPGYHVENKTTYIKIKNQHFTQPNNGSTFYLYYQYRYKGHYSSDAWHLVPYAPEDYIKQTDSEHTLIPFSAPSGQVDVQVRALIGFVTYIPNYMAPGGFAYYEFNGVEGDWSNTQTLTFDPLTSSPVLPSSPTNPDPSSPLNSNNPPPSQPTPQSFLQSNLFTILISACIIVILLSVIVYQYKQRKVPFPIQPQH